MFENREGISTFIATLLLMVLAVSAGVVIYAYTMGYMGGFGGTDTLGAMSLDEASMTTTEANAYVRNIGKTSLAIDEVYVEGVQLTDEWADNPTSFDEGDTCHITITDTFDSGKTYEIKLVCEDNTQISFSVKCK